MSVASQRRHFAASARAQRQQRDAARQDVLGGVQRDARERIELYEAVIRELEVERDRADRIIAGLREQIVVEQKRLTPDPPAAGVPREAPPR